MGKSKDDKIKTWYSEDDFIKGNFGNFYPHSGIFIKKDTGAPFVVKEFTTSRWSDFEKAQKETYLKIRKKLIMFGAENIIPFNECTIDVGQYSYDSEQEFDYDYHSIKLLINDNSGRELIMYYGLGWAYEEFFVISFDCKRYNFTIDMNDLENNLKILKCMITREIKRFILGDELFNENALDYNFNGSDPIAFAPERNPIYEDWIDELLDFKIKYNLYLEEGYDFEN